MLEKTVFHAKRLYGSIRQAAIQTTSDLMAIEGRHTDYVLAGIDRVAAKRRLGPNDRIPLMDSLRIDAAAPPSLYSPSFLDQAMLGGYAWRRFVTHLRAGPRAEK